MLSAKELVEIRQKSAPTLPLIGSKFFEPDCSPEELNSIEESISEIKNILSYERVKILGSLSQAIWRPELCKAQVMHKTGPYWAVMGHTIDQILYLYPEESLYLLEIGALELSFNGVFLSIERAYSVLLQKTDSISVEQYRAYSYLNDLGYKVLRHSPENTVSKYEKQLKVHKLNIKLKKCDSYFTIKKRIQESDDENNRKNKKMKLEIEFKFPVMYKENFHLKEVMKKLQIFQPSFGNLKGTLNFNYDIYSEMSKKKHFKKTCLQLPNYRVIIHRNDTAMPGLREMCNLLNNFEDEVPIIHSVVFPDYVAFYEIKPVIIPDIFF